MVLANAKINTSYAWEQAQKYFILMDFKALVLFKEVEMKVSIGSKVIEGPYGGGTICKNLALYLNKTGNSVVYDLEDSDIDIVLIINPLKIQRQQLLII